MDTGGRVWARANIGMAGFPHGTTKLVDPNDPMISGFVESGVLTLVDGYGGDLPSNPTAAPVSQSAENGSTDDAEFASEQQEPEEPSEELPEAIEAEPDPDSSPGDGSSEKDLTDP